MVLGGIGGILSILAEKYMENHEQFFDSFMNLEKNALFMVLTQYGVHCVWWRQLKLSTRGVVVV